MVGSVFLDSFSGKVAELKPRQQRDLFLVLQVLVNNPSVSTWDMGEHNLWRTMNELKYFHLIEDIERAYPWNEFKVTEKGKQMLLVGHENFMKKLLEAQQ
jgi:hypothetical protein